MSESMAGSELGGCVFYIFLCNGFVHLFQKDTNLVQQLRAVLFNTLAPDKSIFVGFGFNLSAVDTNSKLKIFCFFGKLELTRGELHYLSPPLHGYETIDGDKIRMLITGKPDIMNVTQEKLLYFTARIDIIHVGVDNYLKHHFRMMGQRPVSL